MVFTQSPFGDIFDVVLTATPLYNQIRLRTSSLGCDDVGKTFRCAATPPRIRMLPKRKGNTIKTETGVFRDSVEDHIRPIIPSWPGKRTALLWLRGRYETYTDYDMDVVLKLFKND